MLGASIAYKPFIIYGKEFIPPELTIDPAFAMVIGFVLILLMPIFSRYL